MSLLKFKYNRVFLNFFLLIIGILSSCTDKEIMMPENDPDTGGIVLDYDGFSIGFSVSLDGSESTRGADAIDSYIDTKNKFRILFFDSKGNFIFEAVDRTITPMTNSQGKDLWYVHIPMNVVVDRDDNQYDAGKIRSQLKNENFKIAVLANWPNSNNLIEGDTEIGDDENKVMRPDSYYQKGEPNWGYYNSIVCDLKSDSKYNLKNINDLHHLEDDATYNSTNTSTSRPDNKDVYGFIMKDGKMGVRTNWVKSQFTGNDEAAAWIKTNWDPSQAGTARYLNSYDYLWYLWNFSAANIGSGTRFYTSVGTWGDAWVSKNHYKKNDSNSEDSPIRKFINGFDETVLNDDTDDANLYFDQFDFEEKTGVKASLYYPNPNAPDNNKNVVALRIPNKVENGNGTQDDKQKPYGIRFTANSSGTLRIHCAADDFRKKTNGDTIFSRIAIFNSHSGESQSVGSVATKTPEFITRSISVTEDPVEYYIYCDRGYSADIYEIEYINDQYLYETTRQAIEPSEDFPIPMYGVQDFNAIGESQWLDGSSYDISTKNNTDSPKYISLVRALAKVEIYIPTKYGKPSHVYMRSANRYARCEPMDVENSSNWNLDQNDPHNAYWGNVDKWCEWHNIRYHGRGYMYKYTDGISMETNKGNYQEWLHWFYGSWENTKWLDEGEKPWSFTGIRTQSSEFPSPHIFNPSINRSDYARMIDKGVEGEYYKYVMYMPDKSIDDPNYPGMTESIPKVPHIEYRYNSDANLNDNECYRIYFMDYNSDNNAFLAGIKKDEFEEKVEQVTTENDDLLWPIMRNHIFTFQVQDNGSVDSDGAPVVIAKVGDWGYNRVEFTW